MIKLDFYWKFDVHRLNIAVEFSDNKLEQTYANFSIKIKQN